MKKLTPIFAAALLIFTISAARAQDGLSALIKSGPADATKLVDAYAQPLFKGFGIGMNSGWNNTAKTKKLLHFDLRITASAALVPTSDKTFDVTKIGLSNHVRPADASQTIAPTFAGNSNNGPLMNIYDDNGNKIEQFNTPGGQISVIPAPQLQLTVGILSNTDITLHAIPSIKLGSSGSVSMIGFGLKHDIIQDFVGSRVDRIVPFDLAIAFGYNHLSLNKPLTVDPDNGARPKDVQQSTDFSNQHIAGTFNSFMAQAILSKKLVFFTPFIAVGYNTTHTSAAAVGNYPVTTGYNLALQPTYTTFSNPINISEKSIDGVRADVGFQMELGFFRIYASYSAAQYQSVNGGIGFGF